MATVCFESLAGLTASEKEISEVLFGYRINNHMWSCYNNHIVLILKNEPSSLRNILTLNESYIAHDIISCQFLKIVNRIHNSFATLCFISRIISSKICRLGGFIYIRMRLFNFLILHLDVFHLFFLLISRFFAGPSLRIWSTLSWYFLLYSFFGWQDPHKLRGHLVFFLIIIWLTIHSIYCVVK